MYKKGEFLFEMRNIYAIKRFLSKNMLISKNFAYFFFINFCFIGIMIIDNRKVGE